MREIKMYKIRYIRVNLLNSKNKTGVITVASNLVYGEINDYPVGFEFGVAYSNPHDMFVKKIGRGIAVERLLEKTSRYHVTIPLYAGRKLYYFELDKIVDSYVSSVLLSPSWVKDFYFGKNCIVKNSYENSNNT
jgi:hypothetical protein